MKNYENVLFLFQEACVCVLNPCDCLKTKFNDPWQKTMKKEVPEEREGRKTREEEKMDNHLTNRVKKGILVPFPVFFP